MQTSAHDVVCVVVLKCYGLDVSFAKLFQEKMCCLFHLIIIDFHFTALRSLWTAIPTVCVRDRCWGTLSRVTVARAWSQIYPRLTPAWTTPWTRCVTLAGSILYARLYKFFLVCEKISCCYLANWMLFPNFESDSWYSGPSSKRVAGTGEIITIFLRSI